jgi:hypothetical protein
VAKFYAEHAGALGIAFCGFPTAVFWIVMLAGYWEFRPVYVVRLAVTLLVGGALALYANRYGVKLCLSKHTSPMGPATILDGAAIGAGVGVATGFVGPLTGLIYTNHPEMVKTFIIATWSSSAALGALLGGFLASQLGPVETLTPPRSSAPGPAP